MDSSFLNNSNSNSGNGNCNDNGIADSQQLSLQDTAFDPASAGDHDFLEHMLSTINPSWPDLNPPATPFDDSAFLASKLSQHQITASSAAAKTMLLHQHMLMARGPADDPGVDESVQALYNGFAASLQGVGVGVGVGQSLSHSPPQFQHAQGLGGSPTFGPQPTKPAPAASASTTTASGGQPKQRVRARRGQATDPHSIAERLRRERIAERMKALQELVPNANKTDKASMLDEIIDYVKFLQLQVKVLSMSRLGGAAAVAPLVASSEGASPQTNGNGNDSLNMTEQQVAKLMEEDMGSAMQYLQGKGLCLMPISLATAISTATALSGRPPPVSNGETPTSPSVSALTMQSANGKQSSIKDAASISKS